MNISLKAEYILNIFGINVTNTFFTSILVTILLSVMAIVYFLYRDKNNIFINGMQIFMGGLLKFADKITQDRKLSKKVMPLIATFFLFIVTANLLALVPGFLGSFFIKVNELNLPLLRSPNSDLTTTLALALISVLSIQYFSIFTLGTKEYFKRFFNFTNPIKFILGFFELISEVVKLFSFSFRLFGNIFAGEVLLLVIAFLIPYIIPLPFIFMEIFVGIIQAFIFAILTLTFIKTSTIHHKVDDV